MKLILPILLVLIFTIGIFSISTISQKIGLSVGKNEYINFQINYQLLLLGIAFISLLCSYFLNPERFTTVMSVGDISAIGEELKLLGINKGDSWIKTGISLSIVISVVTGIFMYFHLKGQNIDYSVLKTGIFWVLLFSITNSFSEEMIFRIGINVPLFGLISPNKIFLISAILFGFAHFQGMPNGAVGVIMAGILGYILSKSIHETDGIFWAWWIHFLQDVIIIGVVFLLKSK